MLFVNYMISDTLNRVVQQSLQSVRWLCTQSRHYSNEFFIVYAVRRYMSPIWYHTHCSQVSFSFQQQSFALINYDRQMNVSVLAIHSPVWSFMFFVFPRLFSMLAFQSLGFLIFLAPVLYVTTFDMPIAQPAPVGQSSFQAI